MRLFLDLVNWQSRLAPPDDERDTSVFQVYAGASALPLMGAQCPDRPRHRDDRSSRAVQPRPIQSSGNSLTTSAWMASRRRTTSGLRARAKPHSVATPNAGTYLRASAIRFWVPSTPSAT